jgi:hypothetical protein
MHPFPPTAELQFLVGEAISQIAPDPWSLQFSFESGDSITVEGRIEHVDESGVTHSHNCQDGIGEALCLNQLLQHPISKVDAEPLCLSLTFASGATLRIFSELGKYECGQIGSKQGYIVF